MSMSAFGIEHGDFEKKASHEDKAKRGLYGGAAGLTAGRAIHEGTKVYGARKFGGILDDTTRGRIDPGEGLMRSFKTAKRVKIGMGASKAVTAAGLGGLGYGAAHAYKDLKNQKKS